MAFQSPAGSPVTAGCRSPLAPEMEEATPRALLLCDDGTVLVGVSAAQRAAVLEALDHGGIKPTRQEKNSGPARSWIIHFALGQEVVQMQSVLDTVAE